MFFQIFVGVIVLIVVVLVFIKYFSRENNAIEVPGPIAAFDQKGNYLKAIGSFSDSHEDYFYYYFTYNSFVKIGKKGVSDSEDHDFSFIDKSQQEALLGEFKRMVKDLEETKVQRVLTVEGVELEKDTSQVKRWLDSQIVTLNEGIKNNRVLGFQTNR